jgi:hypothetical protein
MTNKVDINSDGINVYVTSTIKANTVGKAILTLLNLGLLIFYVWFISTIENEEAGKFFLPVILMFVAFIYFPWRYWFWNFYGKENILINTKTITRHYDYGIIETKPKTIPHNRLATSYEFVRELKGQECGRLHFISYSTDTNLPEERFQTSILISKKDIDKIQNSITTIFAMENNDKPSFSVN